MARVCSCNRRISASKAMNEAASLPWRDGRVRERRPLLEALGVVVTSSCERLVVEKPSSRWVAIKIGMGMVDVHIHVPSDA